MRNEKCILGLVERDKYIVFQNYAVSIVMKRRCFVFLIKKRLNKTTSFWLLCRLKGGLVS
jgi:hypothetical protein